MTLDVTVLGVKRGEKRQLSPRGNVVLEEGDVLLIEGDAEDILAVKDVMGSLVKSPFRLLGKLGGGKDEQDWSDLVVYAPPLYIQEKIHPQVLIDDLRKQTEEQEYEQFPRRAVSDRLGAAGVGVTGSYGCQA